MQKWWITKISFLNSITLTLWMGIKCTRCYAHRSIIIQWRRIGEKLHQFFFFFFVVWPASKSEGFGRIACKQPLSFHLRKSTNKLISILTSLSKMGKERKVQWVRSILIECHDLKLFRNVKLSDIIINIRLYQCYRMSASVWINHTHTTI